MIATDPQNRKLSPARAAADQLVVSGLSVSFDDVLAVHNANLNVSQGESLPCSGRGGGKSTLLNVIVGLVESDSGEIRLNGEIAHQRLGRVAYMPQPDALLPWRTVLENATLSAEVSGADRGAARKRARDLLPRFGLEGFGDHYPAALSGGMRQRAACCRTVLSDREVMLLDEPFGALDALTRRTMQEWLLDLWNDLGHTIDGDPRC